MVVHYGPPDLSKIEKFLEKLFSTAEEKREKRVLERYIQLAGLVRNGQMVNKDKESRARTWVAEQEKLEKTSKPKWHQTGWGKFVIGLLVGVLGTVIGGIILAWIL